MQVGGRTRSYSDVVISKRIKDDILKRKGDCELEEKAKSTPPSNITVCLSQEECPICLDEFEPGRALFTAECGHKYHFNCLLENVNHDEANSDKCPICRRPQTQWPEHTSGLVKAHPHCTSCGKKGIGGAFCDKCGETLAHTPTAQERARMQAAAASARNNVVVECPSCQIRCLVSTSARGTLQCPNGHLFQVRMPPHMHQGHRHHHHPPQPNIRQCPTCSTRVQMPPGSRGGQYMCPQGHTFYYRPS